MKSIIEREYKKRTSFLFRPVAGREESDMNNVVVNAQVREAIFEAERDQALSLIDVSALISFVGRHGKSIIDIDDNGNLETVENVIGKVGYLTNKAFVRDHVNYYHVFAARDVAESGSVIAKTVKVKAAKKIIFLNSVCKNQFDMGVFIKDKIQLSDDSQVEALVNAFDFVIRTAFITD